MAEEKSKESASAWSTIEGVKLSDRAAEISCPRCSKEMVFGELLDTKVVVCADCHGMMIQCAAFADMVEVLRQDYVGPEAQPQPINPRELDVVAQCPACWKKMEVHPYCGPGNIVIDSCADCHIVWLDGDELTRVIRGPGKR